MKLAGTILAEGAIVDAMTGRVTIFNMLDAIRALQFPAMLPKLAIVTIYEREGGVGDLSGPDVPPETLHERVTFEGANSLPSVSVLELRPDQVNHTSLHHVVGIVFPSMGTFTVTIATAPALNGPWTTVGTRVLQILQQPPFPFAVVPSPAAT